jgi:hypothetical protein
MPIDAHLILAAAMAALAGLVRGYTGFGAAMVFVPVASLLYGPPVAVALIFLMDLLPTVPLVARALPRSDWRGIVWLAAGASLAIPVGVWGLTELPAGAVRWVIALSILAAVAALSSGWRYVHRPSAGLSLAVGGASGLLGGVASLYGPPVVLFWLSGQDPAPRIRANIMTYFGVTTIVSGASLGAAGLLTLPVLLQAVVLTPIYAGAIWFGSHAFRAFPERVFRPLALALCAGSALAALPVW